jgi:hypothetical protein
MALHTPLGRWSTRLLAVSVALFGTFFALVAAGEKGGDTFFSNPWLASSILAAATLAVVSGGAGLTAIVKEHERSGWVWFAVVLGAIVIAWVTAEIVAPH